jgi:lipid-A-disaccharide synthase
MKKKSIMIIAGEVSGDMHGASLLAELKKLDSTLQVFGIGGDRMRSEGMELIYHIDKMAFLGFAEIIKHLPFIRKVQRDLIAEVKSRKTKHVVLIDYPGFNLSIAKKLKKLEPELIYYISPQVWAWGKGRVKKIKALFKKVLVVFPFEEKFFLEKGVDAEFVGHPLMQEIENYKFLTKDELNTKFDLNPEKEILLILSGSRKHEVRDIFPEAITAAEKLANLFNMQIIAACSTGIDEKIFYELTSKRNFKIVKGYTYDLFNHAKFGIIKSGTSTLEAGLFGLPMVIVYKASKLTYLIGKTLVKIKNIGMANIILEERVVPELIQNDVSAEKIYLEAKNILSDAEQFQYIKMKLSGIKEKLGNSNAPQNAAKIIYSLINEHEKS